MLTAHHWDILRLETNSEISGRRIEKHWKRLPSEAATRDGFHMAAHPLVRRSSRSPLKRWGTAEIVEQIMITWPAALWHQTDQEQPHEAKLLQLDANKAQSDLGWRPVWDLPAEVNATAKCYRAWLERSDVPRWIRPQLQRCLAIAIERGLR
ncbi:hypothetical protein [Bradyrhizobium sp. Ec3.3]|uniref:hypothetical protein n=1 Tax=Bradyrhizobium sp. Ec3.3 TaxID=189753 RepID=UPI000406DCD6|nr:hypothetical protein [Bradyrhizobium sp. Ec3.3]